tara:strand:- start:8393 stop:9385 length:993 start_codon:yes stop_codon:yes gene_type:complete
MKIFNKDLDKDILVVGEIGLNHEGKLKEALKLLKLASTSGLDAIKFQLYNPEKYQSRDNIKRYNRLKKFNLSDDDYIFLKKKARKLKIKVLATPLTEDKVKLAASFGEVVKIASGDINFYPTIDEITKIKKKIILSTGNATLKEIDKTVNYIQRKNNKISNSLALLHCVSTYPTLIENTNIKKISLLKKRYPKLTIGYSNHCCEKEAVLSAVALGAKIVEVHITNDKKNKKFRDHHLSFDKSDLKDLIKSIKLVHKSVRNLSTNPEKIQLSSIKQMRKGIVASKEIKKGQKFTYENIHFARPAIKYKFYDIKKLVGKKSKKNFKTGFLIK